MSCWSPWERTPYPCWSCWAPTKRSPYPYFFCLLSSMDDFYARQRSNLPYLWSRWVETMNMLIKMVVLNNCCVRKLNTFCRMHRLDPDNEEESLVPTLSTFMDIQLALRWSAT